MSGLGWAGLGWVKSLVLCGPRRAELEQALWAWGGKRSHGQGEARAGDGYMLRAEEARDGTWESEPGDWD